MKKKAITQIAFEFLSIVFAVLLALGLNSFKQNQDLKNEAQLLRHKIILECQHNKLELDTVYRLNKAFETKLDSVAQLVEITGYDISIASELLTKTAWDFTKASKSFSFIEDDFLSDAAALYEQQAYYMLISNQMFQNLGQMILTDPAPRKSISISSYYVKNLNTTAENLNESYIQFIKKHQK